MICYLFLKFLNASISEEYLFSEESRASISVAKLRNLAQIVPLRNQCREHCRRAVLRFKRRIGPLSCVLRRMSRWNRCSRRSPLFVKPIGRRSTRFYVTAVITDAQDLVQAFFAHLLAQNTLSHADQAKGRLRTFLLGSLQNFLFNEHDRARALKRGGKYEILSFDQHLPEAEAAMSGTAHLNDVSCYDLTWASNVVRRSWQNLHEAFATEGKAKLLEELKPFVAGGMTNPPNQEDVAARLGVPIATLRTWISRLRQQYRDSLRAEVARTVFDPVGVDEELRYLYRILMS
jgi:DNA-directed RNA polymerase specialized sigma24 family protein